MQIGLLESTGHASGPTRTTRNGQPPDPETFIELARLVPRAEK